MVGSGRNCKKISLEDALVILECELSNTVVRVGRNVRKSMDEVSKNRTQVKNVGMTDE